jgi:hypothetical protein
MGAANGNGAVRYGIAADSPAPGKLVIKDGAFVGPSSSPEPQIKFTAEGYEGTAEAWYAVVPGETGSAPAPSAYTASLGAFPAGENHQATVTLPEGDGNFDIYVVLFKDGKVSGPIKINTGAGGEEVDWIWGDVPYKKFYVASVASGGNDDNPGTKAEPLATVKKALTNLAALYAADDFWPDKGIPDKEVSGGIIILDEVPVAEQIIINGAGYRYPPIILSDEGTPGGKLQAQASIGSETTMLVLQHARVTLGGGLILTGTGNTDPKIRGVNVTEGSTFTMNGGEISGNNANHAGGVRVGESSTFIMNGGVISDNYATNYAGGVLVRGNSTFIMNDGEISGNSGDLYAGGVFVLDGSTFTMNGGEISDNITPSHEVAINRGIMYAGGVLVRDDSTFIMTGGEISGNSAGTQGGGIHLINSSTFIMTGGEIWGNTTTYESGGVYIGAGDSFTPSKFEKTGGTIYGVDDPKGNSYNAVLVLSTYRKATTSGPENILRYNYPNVGDIFGFE